MARLVAAARAKPFAANTFGMALVALVVGAVAQLWVVVILAVLAGVATAIPLARELSR